MFKEEKHTSSYIAKIMFFCTVCRGMFRNSADLAVEMMLDSRQGLVTQHLDHSTGPVQYLWLPSRHLGLSHQYRTSTDRW